MFKLIRIETQAIMYAATLDPDKILFVDTETAIEFGKTDGGLYGEVRLVQVYQKGMKHALIFDCYFLDLKLVLDLVQPFTHAYHNGSYDLHTINLHTPELWMPKDVHDTFYLCKSKYFMHRKFDFYTCLSYAGLDDKHIRAIDKKENQLAKWHKDLSPTMLKYAAMDVLYLSLLWEKIEDAIDEPYRLDIDNLKYTIHYDRTGIPMNQVSVRKLRQSTLIELEKFKSLVPVNPNSPKQCNEWLGTTSTDAETLGIMSLQGNEDAANLMGARKHDKLLQFINKYDIPVAKGFHNSCGARTSRMTCTGGDRYFYNNNQNPPHAIFPCIEAPEGKMIVYKDYSGLELRMTVAYIGEPTMSDMMKAGEDLHTKTGCVLFNRTPETLSFNERTITKFFNFGTVYGAGVNTLRGLLRARGRIDLPFSDVKSLRDKWLELYSYFNEWHTMHKKQMNVYGYIDTVTALGRTIRATTLTDSLNFPIQGSAAEVTKLAVHYLYERYGDPKIINVVHDSIALLHDEDQAPEWVDRLNECMVDAWYYVIKDLAIPDLPMPPEAELRKIWKD